MEMPLAYLANLVKCKWIMAANGSQWQPFVNSSKNNLLKANTVQILNF